MGQTLSNCIPQRPDPSGKSAQELGENSHGDAEEWDDWDEEGAEKAPDPPKGGALKLGGKPKPPQPAINGKIQSPPTQSTSSTAPSLKAPSPKSVTPSSSPPHLKSDTSDKSEKPVLADDLFSDMRPTIVDAPVVTPVKSSRLTLDVDNIRTGTSFSSVNSTTFSSGVGWGDNEESSGGGWADDEAGSIDEDSSSQTTTTEPERTQVTEVLIPKEEANVISSNGVTSGGAKAGNIKKEKGNPKPPTRLVAEKKAVSLSFDDFEDENK